VKLAAKLTLVFLLAFMLLTGLSSYMTVKREVHRFEREQELRVTAMAADIQPDLQDRFRREGLAGLAEMTTLSVPEAGLRVRWVSFRADLHEPDCPAVPRRLLDKVLRGEVDSLAWSNNFGETQLHTYYPVTLDGQPLGGLEATRSMEPLVQETRRTIYQSLATIGVTALFCAVLTMVAGVRMVGRPLETLIEKTNRVGRGDFSGPVRLRGHDELSELGEALNQMCDELQSQQERIGAEAESRAEALVQLRHADRLKTVGRLASGMAHELGTPLNVMAGRADLIASGQLSPQQVQESAAAIKRETDRITGIVRQLLDFARRTTPSRAPVDLNDLAERSLELLKPLARKHQVQLRFQPHGEPCVADVDAGQLQQVVTNIVVNAIQSMSEPGPVTVRVLPRQLTSLEADDGTPRPCHCIEVQDRGPGIDQDDQERIFEPFFTTKDVGQGTGLGLSIAYGIIQEHDGWIAVDSVPGGGSTFRVCLPT